MGSVHRNALFMLVLLKVPLLLLLIYCCTLMNFVVVLSVILLSLFMIEFSALSDEASDLTFQVNLKDNVNLSRK